VFYCPAADAIVEEIEATLEAEETCRAERLEG